MCKRRVIPGGSDSDSEDQSQESSTTSAGGGNAPQPRNSPSSYVDNEPNEDDDTNESSRLLVTTTTTTTTPAPNRTNPPEDSASLLAAAAAAATGNQTNVSVLNEVASGNGAELGSLNNQMLMTTSIGSESGQLFLGPGGMVLSANNSIVSKYGSISSISQLAANNGSSVKATTSAPQIPAGHHYQNLIYQVVGLGS